MTLLGKILLVLNLVAALAFVVLMMLVVGQRNAWQYTAYLHDKVAEGAPIEKDDADATQVATLDDIFRPAREALARDIESSKEGDEAKRQRLERTLQSWARADQRDKAAEELRGVQGVPVRDLVADLRRPLSASQQLKKVRPLLVVKNQQQEVERWKAYLLADLNARPEAARRQRLAQILVPLAPTLDERIATTGQILGEKQAPVNELLGPGGRFDRAFAAAAPGSESESKGEAIARLVFLLSQMRGANGQLEDPSASTRAVVVVGLKAYDQAAQNEAKRLGDMASDLRNDMYLGKNSERAQFIARHQEVLEGLKQLAVGIADQKYVLSQLQAEQAKLADQTNARKATLKEYQDKLAKAEMAVQADKKKQAELEQQIFQAQRDLAEMAEKNADIEREIRRLEGLR